MAALTEEVREWIANQVEEGFDSEEEIIENATLYAEERLGREGLEGEVARLTGQLLKAHRRAQRDWPPVTDCDRLDQAFEALEQQGIVARQHFTCCNTCGHAEMEDEVTAAVDRGAVIGYTFYHFQNTEQARDSGELYLAHSALSDDPEDGVAVGWKILRELRRAGLDAEWAGDLRTKIRISGIEWKRRRP